MRRAKALILENVGDSIFPNLRTKEVHIQPDPPTYEQGTDAPGRSFQPVGKMRSAMEQTDWHPESEETFLDALAARLDAALNAREAKTLIVAAPRALGVLRCHVFAADARRYSRGDPQDYVRLPLHAIEKHLAA